MLVLCCGQVVPARAQTSAQPAASDDSELVWCVDEALSLVKRKPRWRCDGRVVSADEAARIRDARVQRIKRALDPEPVVPGRRLGGTGTGFFITREGHVLTNHHVVDDCPTLTVTPAGREETVATLLGADPSRDLAVLRTEVRTTTPALFRAGAAPRPGEPVAVIGYPLHGRVVIKPQLVHGRVAERDMAGRPGVFTLRVDVRRGNSGGPVLDAGGRVLGVVFAAIDTPAVYARTGKRIRNVALGLSLRIVREFLSAQGVRAGEAPEANPLSADDLFEHGRAFIAQIRCWR